MKLPACLSLVLIVGLNNLVPPAHGADSKPAAMSGCSFAVDNYFVEEVWTKVGAARCLTCPKVGGNAEKIRFVLRDPQRVTGTERDEALRDNRDAFTRMAKLKEGDMSRILVK